MRLIALAVLLIGCGRIGYDPLAGDADAALPDARIEDAGVPDAIEDADAAVPDAGSSVVPWGTFVTDLDVPDCPTTSVLVVDSTGTELDGGPEISSPLAAGPTLSLLEALYIASNRSGTDTILFDATVFPASSPVTIGASGWSTASEARSISEPCRRSTKCASTPATAASPS